MTPPSSDQLHGHDINLIQSDQENPHPSETLNLEEEEETTLQNPYPLSDDQGQDDPDGFHSSSPPPRASLASSVGRRVRKRNKAARRRRAAQERKKRVKLETLLSEFKPIPFVPAKALDFAGHEKLLQRLGLWDFVHLKFDSNLRVDLVAQLIANFNSAQRASNVNGVKIPLNRADMARALRLPPPGKKDNGAKALESVETIAFVEDLVSNWMLLHGEMWMMPNEVMKMLNVIKEGHLEKVEWASLIWFMVEKELMLAPRLKDCYYASHLQCLIKSQQEDLFEEESKVEVNVEVLEPEAVDDSDDVKMVDATDDFQVVDLDECKIELSLGLQDNAEEDDGNVEKYNGDGDGDGDGEEEEEECGEGDDDEEEEEECGEGDDDEEEEEEEEECGEGEGEGDDDEEKEEEEGEDDMDFEECEGEEPVKWLLGGKNIGGKHYVQRGDLGYIEDSDFEETPAEEEEEEEKEEEDQHDGRFCLSPNQFGQGLQLHSHSPGDFLSSRAESHMISDGPSLFGNAHKREYGIENAMSHPHGGLNKRLRSDGSFDNKSDDFYSCMDQMQLLLGKARMMYDTKVHVSAESSMNQQALLNELQQRDQTIHNLHSQKLVEQHQTKVHTYRLERELVMMGNLLQSYRKALKETQRNFAEYRARFPQPDEPLYKDVPESGGLVLSTTEFEKHRLKQLEVMRLNQTVIKKMLNDFAARWTDTFDGYLDEVYLMERKLLGIDKEVSSLKAPSLEHKVSIGPESTSKE